MVARIEDRDNCVASLLKMRRDWVRLRFFVGSQVEVGGAKKKDVR